jgi:hypothetical protein
MQNPFKVSQWTISKVILVLWIVFSVIYVANGLKRDVVDAVYSAGQQAGATTAVVQLIDMAQKCQPIVLTAGDTQISLKNPNCSEQEVPAS